MKDELICTWLGLGPGNWPPNHYALLGLEPGEPDVERIEQRVHERLTQLRQYQLGHPDQVTEAMNRLAQAFTCLTDPKAKKAYDATLLGGAAAAPDQPLVSVSADATDDPLAWLYGPWSDLATQAQQPPTSGPVQLDWSQAPPPPPRLPPAPLPPAEPLPVVNGASEAPVPPAAVSPPPVPQPAPPEPVDPTVQAAQRSLSARRGLGTKRALYYRIARTRQLLRAWDQSGKYLNHPTRRLTRTNEAGEFAAQLAAIRDLLRRFPRILGGAGQPGYYVVILARQHMLVPTFRALILSQREDLARDWRDGRALLLAHRQFLRQELRALRQKSRCGRIVRAVSAFIDDQPGVLLLLLALLALSLALGWHFRDLWWRFTH
ncbi:MAG TPA: hypothetical protein VG013_43780 [Gemmataceae bacterium]|jgi:hypothetical protein|nr:hypothetical protein [Gemmataceae bacterium]